MLLIGGGINIDLLKTNIPMNQNYIDTMLSHNLIPSITIPTRFTERTTTLIDHIFVRLPQAKINNMVTSGNLITDISDHLSNFSIIDIDIKTTKERPYIRLYNQKKIELFKYNIASKLSDITERVNQSDNINVNELYKILYEKLHSLLDLYFPKVRQSRKKAKDKERITVGIKRAIKHRNNLFHIQINNCTNENIEKWKNIEMC